MAASDLKWLLAIAFCGCLPVSQTACTHRSPNAASTAKPPPVARVEAEAIQYVPIDFAWLGSFPFDQDHGSTGDVPDDRRKLDGCSVELVGKMSYMDDRDEPVRRFILSPDNFNWRRPELQALAVVQSSDPTHIFVVTTERVRVKGILRVKVVVEEGVPLYVFAIGGDVKVEALRPDAL